MAVGAFRIKRTPERHDAPDEWRGVMRIVGHPYVLVAHVEHAVDGAMQLVGTIEAYPSFAPERAA